MNHEVMNIFNPQASQQAFDQIKISIASPEKIMSWSLGNLRIKANTLMFLSPKSFERCLPKKPPAPVIRTPFFEFMKG